MPYSQPLHKMAVKGTQKTQEGRPGTGFSLNYS